MNEIANRQAYAVVKKAYNTKQRNPVTTNSDLRLIVPIVSGKTSYTFPIINGEDPNNYPDSVLLDRSDSFTAIALGLHIGKKATASDTHYDLFSYANASEFGASADDLKTIYNATINMTIDNVQFLQNFSTMRNRFAPITQFGQLEYASAPYVNQDSFDGNSGGFTPLVPTLQMNGGSKVNIVLNLPEAVAQLSAGGTIVIVVTLRGFLSLGASNFNLK
jgi:hypothetical protein